MVNEIFFKSKLKFYHIIFLGLLLGLIFILHSNYVNKSKSILKLAKEKRILDLYEGSKEFCSKASDELNKFYITGDFFELDIDNELIEYSKKDEDYINSLIIINQKYLFNSDDNKKLKNDEEFKTNFNKYLNRISPMLAFFIISGISVIIFIFFIFCAFCNCCCCCCFKKANCKIPLLIINLVFLVLIISISIYGLTQTNKISEGLANTQCSYLNFFEDILNGQQNNKINKWIGIDKISNILGNLNLKITEMKNNNFHTQINDYINIQERKKFDFNSLLKNIYKKFYKEDELTPLEGFYVEYPDNNEYYIEIDETILYLREKYVLDLLPLFGRYHSFNKSYSGFISIWNEEFSSDINEIKNSLDIVRTNFENILENEYSNVIPKINNALYELNDLKNSLEQIYQKRKESINKFNKFGTHIKLILNLIFGLLLSFYILFAISLPFLLLFNINSCSTCRCFYGITRKYISHIIWVILSLLMIASLFFGSCFSLIGRLGEDMMDALSFVISSDNFNDINPIIIEDFNDGKEILKEWFIGEGNLTNLFGFENLKVYLDNINGVKSNIQRYLEEIQNLERNYPAYHFLKSILRNKTEFIDDSYLYYYNPNPVYDDRIQQIKLDEILKLLNDSIDDNNIEKWNIFQGDKNFECPRETSDNSSPRKNLLHPWTCEPTDRAWIDNSNNKIKNYAKISSDIIDLLKYSNGTKNPNIEGFQNYYNILDELKTEYEKYLKACIVALNYCNNTINNITNIFENENEISQNIFSFLEGNFAKINLKILLKYLKSSLGKDLYTIGICLIVVGLSLILSVSFIILLMVVTNIETDLYLKSNVVSFYPNQNMNFINENNFNTDKKIINDEIILYDNLQDNEDVKNIPNQDHYNSNRNKNNNNKKKINSISNNTNKFDTSFITLDMRVNKNPKKLSVNKNQNFYDSETIKKKIISLKNEVKIDKLKINLIFFYEGKSQENVNIYNKLKLEVLGGFFGVQKVDILIKLLSRLEGLNTSFTLISTGSSFQKVEKFCCKLNCIQQIIIYCFDLDKYNSLYIQNNRVNLISNQINDINLYLKTKSILFPEYDKNIKKLINYNPLISYYEYENYYYIYHKMLSFYFKEDFSNLEFSEGYMKEMFKFIEKNTTYDEAKKNAFKNIIINLKKSSAFMEDAIKFYTDETDFFYLFNKIMRKMEEGVERISFLIGPMYYSMVRFLNKNPKYCLNESMTLYRKITINQYDLNIYYMAEGSIICFSSFTSTSLNDEFSTTQTAKNVNNIDEKDQVNLLMKLNYNHLRTNKPLGMRIAEFSKFKKEDEILLFPFTFIKVNKIENIKVKDYDFILYCDIINKDSILELGLKEGKKAIIDNNVLVIK